MWRAVYTEECLDKHQSQMTQRKSAVTLDSLPTLQGEDGEDGLDGVDGEQVRTSAAARLLVRMSIPYVTICVIQLTPEASPQERGRRHVRQRYCVR